MSLNSVGMAVNRGGKNGVLERRTPVAGYRVVRGLELGSYTPNYCMKLRNILALLQTNGHLGMVMKVFRGPTAIH